MTARATKMMKKLPPSVNLCSPPTPPKNHPSSNSVKCCFPGRRRIRVKRGIRRVGIRWVSRRRGLGWRLIRWWGRVVNTSRSCLNPLVTQAGWHQSSQLEKPAKSRRAALRTETRGTKKTESAKTSPQTKCSKTRPSSSAWFQRAAKPSSPRATKSSRNTSIIVCRKVESIHCQVSSLVRQGRPAAR